MSTGADIGSPPQARRPTGTVIALILLCALALGVAVGLLVQKTRSNSAAPAIVPATRDGLHGQATWAAGARPAPPIATLVDQTGHRFSLASLRGHSVALAFFDSHCTQACPLEGRALAAAERALPASQRPVLVVVSVNPLDTPASTRAAIRTWGLAGLAQWHWLRGTHALLAAVWRAYHIFVAPPSHGDIQHTEAVYLIDRRGDERSAYLYPFATRFVSSDLATLSRVPRS